jgi:ribosomal protein L34
MKRTYQPNKAKAKKKHGFFARVKAGTGIIKARRNKRRERLTK